MVRCPKICGGLRLAVELVALHDRAQAAAVQRGAQAAALVSTRLLCFMEHQKSGRH